jgi:hypothetical protein
MAPHQEMVRGGREVITGMTQDSQWGPTIVLGLSGILAGDTES